jgi:hypothetical protein
MWISHRSTWSNFFSVSQTEFTIPPLSRRIRQHTPLTTAPIVVDDVVPKEDPPASLMEFAVLILNTPHPTLKVNNYFLTQKS